MTKEEELKEERRKFRSAFYRNLKKVDDRQKEVLLAKTEPHLGNPHLPTEE